MLYRDYIRMIGPAYLGRTSAGLNNRQMPSTCNEQILVREFGVQSIGEQHQNPGSEAQALRAHNLQAHSFFFCKWRVSFECGIVLGPSRSTHSSAPIAPKTLNRVFRIHNRGPQLRQLPKWGRCSNL